MSGAEADRLFATEHDFVRWMVGLLRAHPDFSDVAMGQDIEDAADPLGMKLRPDIIVRHRRIGTMLIECRNRPMYGNDVLQIGRRFDTYRVHRPEIGLALAVPARIRHEDDSWLRKSRVEIWDLDILNGMFAEQIRKLGWPSPAASEALSGGGTRETQLLDDLAACVPGRPHWPAYQKLVGGILEHLFCPLLSPPLSESPDESGNNRRDYVFANFADTGFWSHMRHRYEADYVVVDAKNYVGKVKKRDVLQMANYLRAHGAGLFGIIVCRNGFDTSAWITAREQWAHYRKLILMLDDGHVEAMLAAHGAGGAEAVLMREIERFRLSM